MASLRQIIRDSSAYLEGAGVSEALLSVEWIVQEVLGYSKAQMIVAGNEEVDESLATVIESMVSRRLRGEPVQYIVGHTEFLGYRIDVGPGVLIPRPETEELVLQALSRVPEHQAVNVLDIGTGSGCIAIAVKRRRPRSQVFGVDVSEEALFIARRNSELNDVTVDFRLLDSTDNMFTESLGEETMDLVISNPPYISTSEGGGLQIEVRGFEPHVALFADEAGTGVFRRSLENIFTVLKPGGSVFFEIHAERSAVFAEQLSESGFCHIGIEKDMQGRPRILFGERPSP